MLMPAGESGLSAAARPVQGGKHRRRPPNPTEQARRKAWGREWGAILKAHALTYKRKA